MRFLRQEIGHVLQEMLASFLETKPSMEFRFQDVRDLRSQAMSRVQNLLQGQCLSHASCIAKLPDEWDGASLGAEARSVQYTKYMPWNCP